MSPVSPSNQSNFSIFSKKMLILAVVVLIIVIAYALRKVMAAMTISVVLFYILDPLATYLTHRKITDKISISRPWAVMIATTIGTVVISLLLILFTPPMIKQVKNLPGYQRQIRELVLYLVQKCRGLNLPPEIHESILNIIEKSLSGSSAIIRRLLQGSALAILFSQLILLFMIPFVTFYLLIEKDSMKALIVSIFPRRYQKEIDQILSESSLALRGYISGQLLLSLIMGVLITITLWLLGIEAPLLFGLIAGITKLIPVVGIFLGCIPAALAALSTSKALAIWVVIIFTIIQLFENKVILPVMLSRYVDLSPLTILCALIIGEQLGGVLGMFLSTPIVAVFRVIYLHIRPRYN